MPIDTTIGRVVVFIQENKTPDFYFPSLAAWGADVVPFGALLGQPPDLINRTTATHGFTSPWATTRACDCRSTTTR
jgi:hypothetical protein